MNKKTIKHIMFLLLPVFALQALLPRIDKDNLRDALAHQPVIVYSFVWMPLLEVSVMIANKVIPAPTIGTEATEKNSNHSNSAIPTANTQHDYLIQTIAHSIILSFARPLSIPQDGETIYSNYERYFISFHSLARFFSNRISSNRILSILDLQTILPRSDIPPALCRA